MRNIESYARHLFSDEPKSLQDHALLLLLGGVEKVYAFLLNMWVSFYDIGHLHRHRLDAYTLSIGNITAGGTGKTPLVRYMAQYLLAQGERVAIISRGYRSGWEERGGIVSDGMRLYATADEAGDEPYLLARVLPQAIVAVGKKRAKIAARVETKYRPTIVLLDDAFQHWSLQRDVDIVLIDATNPFSNGRVLPRGLLREPLDHLERAHMYVVTKADAVAEERLDEIIGNLRSFSSQAPIMVTAHHPGRMLAFADWAAGREHTAILPRRVVTMCALGNPDSFERSARQAGLQAVGHIRHVDHHRYTAEDWRNAQAYARREKAQGIVVTEKDAVKLLDCVPSDTEALYVLTLDLRILSGEREFWEYIEEEREVRG